MPAMPFTFGANMELEQAPELQWFIATNAAGSAPAWRHVPTNPASGEPRVRSYNIARGRGREREQTNTGTLSLEVDNRDRDFDPTYASSPYSPNLRPGNRVWLRALYDGVTQDRFIGHVQGYAQAWPAYGKDAVTVISAADEFHRAARGKMAVMDPPTAASYADVVAFDKPTGYWQFSDFNNLGGSPGPPWSVPDSGGGYGITSSNSPIVGQSEPDIGALSMAGSASLIETSGDAFDSQSSNMVTVEFWINLSGTPGSTSQFFGGRVNAVNTGRDFYFEVTTSRTITFTATNTTPGLTTVTSSALNLNEWYHIVGTIDGTTMRIYVNGVQAASTGWSGLLLTSFDDQSSTLFPFISGFASFNYVMDEVAFYPARALTAARILAHYTAGRNRGIARNQAPADFAAAVLDSARSHAPRNLMRSPRQMESVFQHGQPPIDPLREAERAELTDGFLFVSRSGAWTLLDDDHRGESPWDTVQTTFGEGGGEVHYDDVQPDYSDAFMVNKWAGQRVGGELQTATDAAAVDADGEYADSVTGLLLNTDGQVLSIVTDLLSKTRDPMHRIVSLSCRTTSQAATNALLDLELGDRIRILWTPPAGGSRIDQTSFVQSIKESGDRDSPLLRFDIGVSPL